MTHSHYGPSSCNSAQRRVVTARAALALVIVCGLSWPLMTGCSGESAGSTSSSSVAIATTHPAEAAPALSEETAAAPSSSIAHTALKPASDPIELIFPYGSEKEKWLEAVTKRFNQGGFRTHSGRPIHVKPMAMGSGEMTAQILDGRLQAHIASPASEVFVVLGDAESRARTGRPLLGKTRTLVLSPVVIAMWRPMAEAIGWGKRPLGWSDILALARSSEGWGEYGYPQWGRFKFGHTHPEYSNSGIISLFAIVYAASGKVGELTTTDVGRPEVGEYLQQIERSIVHYGSSTGFLGRKMYLSGPQYLSAAVLYENMVIESYDPDAMLPFPIVAIYPKEGTFWSDHPAGIVERDWVTEEHREAAELYFDFLEDVPQQEEAIRYGFRPGNPRVAPAAPIDLAHGVDPTEPKTTLAVPSTPVINAVSELFRARKKHANLILAVDVSGSMLGRELAGAQDGAAQMVELLGPQDRLSVLAFNNAVTWKCRGLAMQNQRAEAERVVRALQAVGNTSLYDAIDAALADVSQHPEGETIDALVVLSDGDDNASGLTLPALIDRLRDAHAKREIPIFTIGYGPKANQKVLREIAETTGAKSYEAAPDTIREVFKTISTFF